MSTAKKSTETVMKVAAKTASRTAIAAQKVAEPAKLPVHVEPQTSVSPVPMPAPVPIENNKTTAPKNGSIKTDADQVTQRKPVAKVVKNTAVAKPAKAEKIEKTEKAEKLKKAKLVRDSFTIPKAEYLVLEALKGRAGKLSQSVKKSELLRAGIKALAAMPEGAFLKALSAVPTIKTGRPSKVVLN